jgi:hypothetical protein
MLIRGTILRMASLASLLAACFSPICPGQSPVVSAKPLGDIFAPSLPAPAAPAPTEILVHSEPVPQTQTLNAGYDRGFFIEADDLAKSPFRLLVNFQNQFRYTGFGRTEREWIDATGTSRPIAHRNDFDIIRGRILFSGIAIDEDLHYYVNLDYATLRDDDVAILMAWWNYRFSKALDFYVGKGKVPGGREWVASAMDTMSPDRSLATTFFRPSITTGTWVKGEPLDDFYYHAGIGNGFNTASSGFRDLDTNFVYMGNVRWEPRGEFGGLYSDHNYRDTLATRLGGSITASKQSGQQVDISRPEQSLIRLSDGTDLTLTGALAPDFQVTEYSIYLATIDAGMKYKGLSLHGEYFLRWLSDIQGTGPVAPPLSSIFDHGFHVQAGAFLIPKYFELFTRTSTIKGPFGGGEEVALGFNYFFRGSENWRLGCDVTYLNDSPAEQIRTGYDAGASGILVRGQLQTFF